MKPQEAKKKQLLDCEDKMAQISIEYGKGSFSKNQFDNAMKQINEKQLQILIKAKML